MRLTLNNAVLCGYIVAALLSLDVIIRALSLGYDGARVGAGEMAIAIVVAAGLVKRREERGAV